MTVIDLDMVVKCSAPSHHPRVCKVAGYVRMEDGGWVRAAVDSGGPENAVTFLTGDHPIDTAERRTGLLRQHDNLKCSLCPQKVSLRAEDRDRIWDGLHSRGVTSIDLARLARILS